MKGLPARQAMLLKGATLKMTLGGAMLYGSSFMPLGANGFLFGAGIGLMFVGLQDFVKATDGRMDDDKKPDINKDSRREETKKD